MYEIFIMGLISTHLSPGFQLKLQVFDKFTKVESRIPRGANSNIFHRKLSVAT